MQHLINCLEFRDLNVHAGNAQRIGRLRHRVLPHWGNLGHIPEPGAADVPAKTHQPLSALPSYPFALPLPYFIPPLENIFPANVRFRKKKKNICNNELPLIFEDKFPATFSAAPIPAMGTRATHKAEPKPSPTPGPAPAPGTPIAQGQGATFGYRHHRRNSWVLNLTHGPDRSAMPPSSPAAGMPAFDRGGPRTCLAFGRTKEKSSKCGSWGGPGTVTKNFAMGKKKSLPLTIPHKNVREIIKSICTAGGPWRRHRRAQRDGLAPILGRREGARLGTTAPGRSPRGDARRPAADAREGPRPRAQPAGSGRLRPPAETQPGTLINWDGVTRTLPGRGQERIRCHRGSPPSSPTARGEKPPSWAAPEEPPRRQPQLLPALPWPGPRPRLGGTRARPRCDRRGTKKHPFYPENGKAQT